MCDVKSVISLLCKHLKILYDVDLRAEHFRLAKFNKAEKECVQRMWTLLEKLCREIHQPWLNIENPVHYVKLHFMALGYKSIEFYSLPSDMSAGSRELLLAFGWILLTQDLLETTTLKKVRMSPLNMEFDSKILQQNSQMESSKSTKEYICSKGSLENKLNFVLWCAGKIRYNLKAITELGDNRIKTAHMVHKSTVDTCGLPHLSVLETQLVRHPERLSEFITEVKNCSEVTDSHILWLKKLHVFWEWMESVVAEKKSNYRLNGFHLGVNDQKVLSQLLAAARLHLKHFMLHCLKENDIIRPCVSQNSYLNCDKNSRFIFHSKDTESEMNEMLSDSELQLHELETTCSVRKEKLLLKLQQVQEEMENTLVIFSQFD